MSDDLPEQWNRKTCRDIIDRMKDGKPPPAVAINYMSVGYEHYLSLAMRGLNRAAAGGYAVMLLEGSYGAGKTHLLRLIGVIAEQQRFATRWVEVGSSGVYLNQPPRVFRKILAGEGDFWRDDYDPFGPYYGDQVRKFAAGIKLLTTRHRRNGARGLVILLDELENTMYSANLPRFESRARAYKLLNLLFRGRVRRGDSERALWPAAPFRLNHVYVAMAITPGTLERAPADTPNRRSGGENPAREWKVPPSVKITPLLCHDASELARRIRAVHSRVFAWDARGYVPDEALESACRRWVAQGDARDERQLVKQIVEMLEIAEQNR